MMEPITHFLQTAKEVNFNLLALYDKEPLIMQIIAGVLFVIVMIIVLVIRSKMRHASAHKAVESLESYVESFDDYQKNLQKILKTIRSAQGEFLESLLAKKEDFYKDHLRTLRDEPLEAKIDKYQEMAALYNKLAKAAKDEKLSDFYADKAQEILNVVLLEDISEYMKNFSFTPEDVAVLEKIVAYANTQEDKEAILSIVMEKLQSVDYGSNLERYNFVKNLDPEKLGDIYTYIKEQQEKLFESGERVVAAEVLEYLLENGEKAKVLSYIKALKVPTHLQELYYRFFNQKDMQELDFAFIANPVEINQQYADYLENLITDAWRDDKGLEKLLEYENLSRVIGHDRVRNVIERIDTLRKEFDEKEMAQEALQLAKDAHRLALETKTLMDLKEKNAQKKVQELIGEDDAISKEKENEDIKKEEGV